MKIKEKNYIMQEKRANKTAVSTLQLSMEELLGAQITSGTTVNDRSSMENHKCSKISEIYFLMNVFLKDDDSGEKVIIF